MNKSEIAEREKFEQFLRDTAGKRFPCYRSINGFTFTGGDSGLLWECWERAIAESQAPQPDQFLPFLRQIRDLSKWGGPDAAPNLMHEIWQKVSTAIANIEWENYDRANR